MSDDNSERRRPRNMQGLLQFCLSAGSSEDTTGETQPRMLSESERAWITEAMQAAMGKDPVKAMIEHVQLLTHMGADMAQQGAAGEGEEEGAEERRVAALDEISMYCDDLDLAKDFYSIGGYVLLPRLLEDTDSEIRWRAAELIATLVQNNPFCQAAALELGFMEKLLGVLNEDSVEMVKIKALYAVSCLSRECEAGQEALIQHDGLSALIKAMQAPSEKLETKAAFLTAYLCSTSPKIKDMLGNMGAVEQLVSLLQAPHAPHHEHIMAALHNLTTDNAHAQRECRRPELQLQLLLSDRIKLLTGSPEFEEELEMCQTMLTQKFPENTESADQYIR